ncbi:hypothetical protein AHAS_Ahas03G0144700 [Arachis hypogaea]
MVPYHVISLPVQHALCPVPAKGQNEALLGLLMRMTMVLSSSCKLWLFLWSTPPSKDAHLDCSPVAMSVVSIVSGISHDIRRLSDAISRQDAVVRRSEM